MLDSLFLKGSWEIVHHREWRAYPVLNPKKVTAQVVCRQTRWPSYDSTEGKRGWIQ